MSTEVQIIVSGPVGCGKSALLEEINIALNALGVATRFANPKAVQSERNMVPDPTDLEPFRDKIVCVLHERIGAPEPVKLAYGLLWGMSIDRRNLSDDLAYRARQALLGILSKEDQAAGIEAARSLLPERPRP